MDTPNTRSRAKRDLEASITTPGASQDEPRVLWEHDRRFKREFVHNMKEDALPLPVPTQQPSLPRFSTNPAASNRPRKRPCNRNRSVPSGSLHAASPMVSSAIGPSSAPAETSNLDNLLKDYFALHGGSTSSSTSHQEIQSPAGPTITLASPSSTRTALQGETTPAQATLDHPLPQMSALALDSIETPSKRTTRAPKSLQVSRASSRPLRETPTRDTNLRDRPAAPSPLQAIPLQASQSRRLGPTLSQGETAKSLGPPPRIGLRQSHETNKPAVSHNPAKAFKSPLPGTSQGLRSSPRRQAPPQPAVIASHAKNVSGPVRAVQGDTSNPRPSPLRVSRHASVVNAPAAPAVRNAPMNPPRGGKFPVPKTENKMPSSDGAGTGDDSFGSFEVEDMDAFLREVDGLSAQ